MPPVIDITPLTEANEAEEITFLASVRDPGQDILSYEWDFGDGSKKVHDTAQPKHTYDDDGTYTLNLRVKDVDFELNELVVRGGKWDTDRRTILPVLLEPQMRIQTEKVRIRLEENLLLPYQEVVSIDITVFVEVAFQAPCP